MVKHNGVLYRAADAHAHIYPGKIAEKATENVGRFYDLPMAEVGLPHVLNEEGTAVGFDKFLVCSVATKVEQVGSINRFIAAKCEKYPKFMGTRSARRAAAVCDPFSSVPFGSRDLLGTEEKGPFRRPVAALETE